MNPEHRPGSTIGGISWSALARFGTQIIRAVTVFALTRFVVEDDFGLMAGTLVVVALGEMLVDIGTGQALVQAQEVSHELRSTVFFTNLVIATGVAAAVFFGATPVAQLVGNVQLRPFVEAITPALLGPGLVGVHVSLLHREMRFRAIATVQLAAALVGAVVSIAAAAQGWGVWALVAGFYAETVCGTIGYWLASGWRPAWHFDPSDLRRVFNFSANLTGVNVASYVFEQLDTVVVTHACGSGPMGIYWLAKKIMVQPVAGLFLAVQSVVFAQFSRIQDDHARIRAEVLKVTAGAALLLFPFAVGGAILAEPLLLGVAGEKWRAAAPLVALLAPLGLALAVAVSGGAVFRAKGRTDLLLRWGLVRGLIRALGLVAGIPWGLHGIVAGFVLASLVLLAPALWIPFRLIDLRLFALYRPLKPVALAVVLMGMCVLAVRQALYALSATHLTVALCGVLVGAVVYVVAILWLRPPEVLTLWGEFTARWRSQQS